VKIGNQWWMVENLKVTRYQKCDPLVDGSNGLNVWTGAYCSYNNDPKNDSTYGKLYNGDALSLYNNRKIAPVG